MKQQVNRKQIMFYIWTGVAYMLFWILIDIGNNEDHIGLRILNNIWRAIYITFINFFFFEYLLSIIRRKRISIIINILLGIILVCAELMLCTFGLYIWRAIGIGLHVYTSLREFTSVSQAIGYGAPAGIFSLLFFGIIKHLYDYQQLKAAAQKLRIEKQEAELQHLKSQTNPHFLFNTLNNIYSLAKDKSDLAPESIVRLSKILRFMLYEAGGEYISIEMELKIINDYIALEKLRYDDTLRINFNYDVEDMKQAIPPLLLIPLVENAFKHGTSETRHQPFVDIHLAVNNRLLSLIVKNSTDDTEEINHVKENIGLSNLRRQLELLYTDYALSVKRSDSVFVANLKINLATHVNNQVHSNRR